MNEPEDPARPNRALQVTEARAREDAFAELGRLRRSFAAREVEHARQLVVAARTAANSMSAGLIVDVRQVVERALDASKIDSATAARVIDLVIEGLHDLNHAAEIDAEIDTPAITPNQDPTP